MTVKEKMIEVFGEEKVENLIKALRPSNMEQRVEVYSPSYVKLLEFLLDEYKEPCRESKLTIPETADPLSQPVPLPSRWSPEAYAEWKKNKEAKTENVVKIENEEYNTVTEVPVPPVKRADRGPRLKPIATKGRKKVDVSWYVNQVEDFFLSNEKLKTFKISDDKSGQKAVQSIDGLKNRFMIAIKDAKLGGDVSVHKYYCNTTNECVALENTNIEKDPNVTYKLP